MLSQVKDHATGGWRYLVRVAGQQKPEKVTEQQVINKEVMTSSSRRVLPAGACCTAAGAAAAGAAAGAAATAGAAAAGAATAGAGAADRGRQPRAGCVAADAEG